MRIGQLLAISGISGFVKSKNIVTPLPSVVIRPDNSAQIKKFVQEITHNRLIRLCCGEMENFEKEGKQIKYEKNIKKGFTKKNQHV